VIKQAASLKMDVDALLPGIRVETGLTNFAPVSQLQPLQGRVVGAVRFGDRRRLNLASNRT
jgi:hypothetical protein